jgi:RNA polymerase sigma-70 factor (ECF subfamily)
MSSSAVSLNLIVKNPDEDFKLVEETLAGSAEAFRKLFIKNIGKVHSLCLRITTDVQSAEDLTQEVFIKAWEKLSTFRYECKFSTWLHSIAVNQFMMQLRSQKRYSEKIKEYGEEITGTETKTDQDHKIDLQKAISNLSEQMRAVLVMHDIEGYKHKEIAEMMNIQEGTSKTHLHRARKILRQELSK